MPKILLTLLLAISFLFGLFQPSAALAVSGDANGDGVVDGPDYVIWLNNYNKNVSNGSASGDFNNNGFVDGTDYVVWLNNYTGSGGSPTLTSTPPAATGYIDHAICDPDLGSGAFTNNITNQYLPFSTGYNNDHLLLDSSTGFLVRMRILSGTKPINGADGVDPVKALVLEEYETRNGSWVETSVNWFAQTVGGALPGTVCYFGEDVATPGNPNGGAHGSWEAGKPNARAGIMMPPNPVTGMNWLIEDAAAYGAYEDGVVQSTGQTFTTPAGTFNDVVYIIEDSGNSNKRYTPQVGMISDQTMLLTQY